MKLNYYRRDWSLYLKDCPCDLHFSQYLERKKISGKVIFHFGTGEHHLIGRSNHERGNPNEILAVTLSRGEHDAYIDFIVTAPIAANYYRVLFGDIYTFSARMLPKFDIATLFHLCEYYDDREYRDDQDYAEFEASGDPHLNSAYARLDDAGVVELFRSKLNPGGKLVFFKGSALWDEPSKIVETFIAEGKLIAEDEYETLLICGTP